MRINEIEQSKVIKKRMSQLSSTADFATVFRKRDYGMMDRAGDDDGLWIGIISGECASLLVFESSFGKGVKGPRKVV